MISKSMASLHYFFSSSLLFFSLLLLIIITPINSLTCTSQNLTTITNNNNKNLYTNCTDLPTLSSYLHYTYNSTNSTLSIAFIAPPAKSDGWIAWGINPNGTGMVGTQALVAMKGNESSLVVKTYNLVSYRNISEEKLSFDVWDLSAVSDGDNFVLFAKVKLNESVEKVNQVWQVGPSVTNGKPDKHEFATANLNAKGELVLVTSATTTTMESNLGFQLGCFLLLIGSFINGF